MQELSMNEALDVNGGSNLGNTLVFIGGAIITVASGGTAGAIAGLAISAVGLIGSWE